MRDEPIAVLPSRRRWPLHDSTATRALELAAQAGLAPHVLMARAGLATARMACAVAPDARRILVLAGPGNNGGDGVVAARHLRQWGQSVRVHLLGDPERLPDDARVAWQAAQAAGVEMHRGLPEALESDLLIDGLLGLGARRAPEGDLAVAIERINASGAVVLSIDLPSGLHPDTGQRLGAQAVVARHTLSLLTLKPGLFTAQGRDHAGRVWFDPIGVDCRSVEAIAWLSGPECWQALAAPRRHAQHKGSFGDVRVIGGAPGMAGAPLLAARAALVAGAGRVMVSLLDVRAAFATDASWPELMVRSLDDALMPANLGSATVACGCGGGSAIASALPPVLHHAARLVLDADGLNAVAAEPGLRRALASRAARGLHSILTPHPLEAARLLGCDSAAVQADRLAAARRLAEELQCTVVLKGSGSVTASRGQTPSLNPSGNARLATAGSGDVLAGWTAGLWASSGEADPHAVAAGAVWSHGQSADADEDGRPLLAGRQIDRLSALSSYGQIGP